MTQRWNSLQWLRGFAALAVVVFHASGKAGHAVLVGQAGVDVFFVLSGVVMWMTTARPVTAGAFLRKRIDRIVPLYWAATAVFVAGALAGLFPNAAVSPGSTVRAMLFFPDRGPNGEFWPPLVQGWTLNYEALFYVVFAAGLLLPRPRRLIFLVALFGGLVALGRLMAAPYDPLVFWSEPIILEFLAGVLIGACMERPGGPPAIAGGLLALTGLVVLLTFGLADPGPLRVLVYGGPACAMVAGFMIVEKAGRLPPMPMLVLLGDASYAAYLFHTFAISLVWRVIGPALPFPLAVAALVTAGTVAGVLVHVGETRLRRLLRTRPETAAVSPR